MEDSEVGLLDLLVVMAENWILLVVVPLLAGLATYVFASLQPVYFSSTATLPMSQNDVARLIEIIASDETELAENIGLSYSEILQGAALRAVTDNATQIQLSLPDVRVDHILSMIIAQVRSVAELEGRSSIPGAEEIVLRLEEQILVRERMINTLGNIISELEAADRLNISAYVQNVSVFNELATAQISQMTRLATLKSEVYEQSANSIWSDPVEPTRLGRSPTFLVILVVIGALFFSIISIILIAGVRGATKDIEFEHKINRIRRAFFIHSSH